MIVEETLTRPNTKNILPYMNKISLSLTKDVKLNGIELKKPQPIKRIVYSSQKILNTVLLFTILLDP
jgi:hypothetical protein